jgi:hypothetical protein
MCGSPGPGGASDNVLVCGDHYFTPVHQCSRCQAGSIRLGDPLVLLIGGVEVSPDRECV